MKEPDTFILSTVMYFLLKSLNLWPQDKEVVEVWLSCCFDVLIFMLSRSWNSSQIWDLFSSKPAINLYCDQTIDNTNDKPCPICTPRFTVPETQVHIYHLCCEQREQTRSEQGKTGWKQTWREGREYWNESKVK